MAVFRVVLAAPTQPRRVESTCGQENAGRVRTAGLRTEQGVIAIRVKELRQEIAKLARYHEEYASLRGINGVQKRLQENRIERMEEIKRELGNYVKSPQGPRKPATINAGFPRP